MQLRAKSAFPVRAWVCSTSGGATMLDMAATAADRLGQILTDEFKRNFGSGHSDRAERLGSIARVALECLARSDALCHTVEHTFLVTLVGLDVLRRALVLPDGARAIARNRGGPKLCSGALRSYPGLSAMATRLGTGQATFIRTEESACHVSGRGGNAKRF